VPSDAIHEADRVGRRDPFGLGLELAPNLAEAHASKGVAEIYLALGRPDQSQAAARLTGKRIEAAFGRDPEVAEVLAMGAATLVYLDDAARAEEWAKRALLLDLESYTVSYNVACAYTLTGKPDIAQECLELAFLQTPRARGWLYGIAQNDTQLDALRGRPDFQDLKKRLEAEVAARS
jgi:adenylate cyclase